MMMFTRLGRSISQSYRSRNVFGVGNGGRSQTLTRSSVYQSRYIKQADDNLGVLNHYFGSLAANNGRNDSGLLSKVYTSDINSILANPRIRRFFTSEAPKKEDDDNFHSKEMIETPKQKSESKEKLSTEDIIFTLVIGWLSSLVFILIIMHHEEQKIDFKTFKNGYLKRRLVDHIVIINNSVAEVHLRLHPADPHVYGENLRFKVYMNIESVESFEEQLKEAQEELAREFHVPVLYTFK